mmetsp:Transcript_18684/g.37474  ORF Transcript_18684/g.37474 Transcript_18684/m.37474 type:complete len:124 (+) Transcript_18684:1398-1769(+)
MNECFFNGMEWNAMGRIDPINQGREAKYCSLARVDWGSRAGGVFFFNDDDDDDEEDEDDDECTAEIAEISAAKSCCRVGFSLRTSPYNFYQQRWSTCMGSNRLRENTVQFLGTNVGVEWTKTL